MKKCTTKVITPRPADTIQGVGKRYFISQNGVVTPTRYQANDLTAK
ncbi:MAG TPA: hypothetical protein VJC15_04420 [Candidatus Paceibacterota bacterium]